MAYETWREKQIRHMLNRVWRPEWRGTVEYQKVGPTTFRSTISLYPNIPKWMTSRGMGRFDIDATRSGEKTQ